jgi:hypothetical protein
VNAGTAGASLAASFTTASFGALTGASVATGTATLAGTGIPSFAYNGSFAMTTNTTQASYLSGPFQAGILISGSSPVSIDLKSTAALVTGTICLIQPWFALAGS